MRKLLVSFALALVGAAFGGDERLVYSNANRIIVAGWNNHIWTSPNISIPRPENCVLWLACDRGWDIRSYGRIALTGYWDATNCTSPPPQSASPNRWTWVDKTGCRFSNGSGIFTNLLDATRAYTYIAIMSRPAVASKGVFAIGAANDAPSANIAGMQYSDPAFVHQRTTLLLRQYANDNAAGWTNRLMHSCQYDGSFLMAHMHTKTNLVQWTANALETLTTKLTWGTTDIAALGIGRAHNDQTYNSRMTLYHLLIFDVELTDTELATIYANLY